MSDMPDEVWLGDKQHRTWPAWTQEDAENLWKRTRMGSTRYILAEHQTAPKVLRLTVNAQDVYYEPRSATDALLALLAEEKKRAEQAEADRDLLGEHLARTKEELHDLREQRQSEQRDWQRWALEIQAELDRFALEGNRLRAALEEIRKAMLLSDVKDRRMQAIERIVKEVLSHD